jgi:hypothetical protein
MKLKRYELHKTQAGSHMRLSEFDGEWCDADDVERLEMDLSKCFHLLRMLFSASSETIKPSLHDECVRFMLSQEQ